MSLGGNVADCIVGVGKVGMSDKIGCVVIRKILRVARHMLIVKKSHNKK